MGRCTAEKDSIKKLLSNTNKFIYFFKARNGGKVDKMRRSTTKEVKEIIKNYIMSNFEDIKGDYINKDGKAYSADLEIMETVNSANYREVCNAILTIFKAEKLTHDNRYKAGRISKQDLFIEWCSGLCSAIDTSYYYNVCAVDLLGNWLDQTEAEKNKFSESEAEYRISSLIYRELLAHATAF